jgi:transcriptional regulator with XRE-family HTH domain
MRVKEWVKAARKHKGWTQDALGEALGVSKSNVSAWENGHHEPSIDQWLRIAQLTGHPALPGQAETSLPAEVQELVERVLLFTNPTERAAAVENALAAVGLFQQRLDERARRRVTQAPTKTQLRGR